LQLQGHRTATEFKFCTPSVILNGFLTPTAITRVSSGRNGYVVTQYANCFFSDVGVKLGLSCAGNIIGQGCSRVKCLGRCLCQRGTSGRVGKTASLFLAKENWDDHIRDD
jgi:hypothetical protein